MSRIIASFYPNGECRVVMCPDLPVKIHLSHEAVEVVIDGQRLAVIQGEVPDLDITSKLRTAENPKPGFGGIPTPTQFGNNARRTISRAAGVFDADAIPLQELVFLTGTIPGSTKEAFDAVACWSSYAVDLTKSHLAKRGAITAYSLYVWEYQKRGALHLHYCLHLPDEKVRRRVLFDWKAIWTNVLDAICKKSGVDVWARAKGGTWAVEKSVLQADAQVVYKSVGSYLAKYLGKQQPYRTGANNEGEIFLPPVRWWGVSRPLLARLRELSDKECIENCSVHRERFMRESIAEVLTYSANPVHHYYSKSKNAEVWVTYDRENQNHVHEAIARILSGAWGKREGADISSLGGRAENIHVEFVPVNAEGEGCSQLLLIFDANSRAD